MTGIFWYVLSKIIVHSKCTGMDVLGSLFRAKSVSKGRGVLRIVSETDSVITILQSEVIEISDDDIDCAAGYQFQACRSSTLD